ncbi:MAG: hypothetical protein VKP57_03250 [Candidatus Sericytochromatia bacterium]|nr:hypothetical protein [Candidatus Sericytochromatia bacterium]
MSRSRVSLLAWVAALVSAFLAWPALAPDHETREDGAQARPLEATEADAVSRRARRLLRQGQDLLAAAGPGVRGVHLDWAEQRLAAAGWVVLRQTFPDDTRPKPVEQTSLLAVAPGLPVPRRVVALDWSAPEPMGLVTLSAFVAAATWLPPASSSQPVAWWLAGGRDRRSLGLRRPPEALARLVVDPEVWVVDASAGWPGRPLGHRGGSAGDLRHPVLPAGLLLTLNRSGLGSPEASFLADVAPRVLGLGGLEPEGHKGESRGRRHHLAVGGPAPTERTGEVILSPALEERAAQLAPALGWLASRPVVGSPAESSHTRNLLAAAAALPVLPLLLASMAGRVPRPRAAAGRGAFLAACFGLPILAFGLLGLAASRSDWTAETGRPGVDWMAASGQPLVLLGLVTLVGLGVIARLGARRSRSPEDGRLDPAGAFVGALGHLCVVLTQPWAGLLGTGPILLVCAATHDRSTRRPLVAGIAAWGAWVLAWGRQVGLDGRAFGYVLNRLASASWTEPAIIGTLVVAGLALSRALLPVRSAGTRPAAR